MVVARAADPAVPELVVDLGTAQAQWSSSAYVPMGSSVYLTGSDSAHGAELWKSDGTPAGTVLVKDLQPGSGSSTPRSLIVAGSQLFFTATLGTPSYVSLWKSDGTAAGTTPVTGRAGNPLAPDNLTAFGNRVAFTALDSDHGRNLWLSDGTPAGTALVKNLYASDAIQPTYYHLTAAAGALYFTVSTTANSGALWRSDGTAAGTVSLLPDQLGDPYGFTAVGSTVYFFARVPGSVSYTLWRTGGTAATTVQVSTITLGTVSTAPTMVAFNGHLYFTANSSLWRSDGTAATTLQLASLSENRGIYLSPPLSHSPAALYFFGRDSVHGESLWKSDGTSAGTAMLYDLAPGTADSYPDHFTAVGNTLFFTADQGGDGERDLWTTDGTAAGTKLVHHFVQSVKDLQAFNGKLIFTADGGTGLAFWTSDGTAAGTTLIKDFVGTADSNPSPLGVGAGLLFFYDFGDTQGLYSTDGTAVGTHLAKNPQLLSYGSTSIQTGATLGSSVIFAGTDLSQDTELWKSDGTTAGTVKIMQIRNDGYSAAPGSFTTLGDSVYFSATDGIHGRELWKTDGTTAGTTMVADLNAGASGFEPGNLVDLNGQLLFTAPTSSGSSTWTQLWKSDGTAAGTASLGELGYPRSFSGLTVVGDLAYFVNDSSNAAEIWRTDGTTSGTFAVGTIPPGFQKPNFNIYAGPGSHLFFATFYSYDQSQAQVWRSDGTASGTFCVIRAPGTLETNFSDLAVSGDHAWLWMRAATNYQLYSSDGTATAGPMVAATPDLNTRPNQSLPGAGNLYFYFDDGTALTLWKSDATVYGTGVVPVALPSPWSRLTTSIVYKDALYFSMSSDAYGRELYRLPFSALANSGDLYRAAYRSWASAAGLTSDAAADPLAQPFGDATNLLKYASFVDPSQPGAAILTVGTGIAGLPSVTFIGSPAAPILHLEFIRRKDSGLIYTPEISDSLTPGSFIPLTDIPVITEIDASRERVTLNHSIPPGGSSCFLHVAVSGP